MIFFSQKKNSNSDFGFFFQKKKSKFGEENKLKKKLRFFKFSFFHMDGPSISRHKNNIIKKPRNLVVLFMVPHLFKKKQGFDIQKFAKLTYTYVNTWRL